MSHANIAKYLPPELGLLTIVCLFQANSNRFFWLLVPTDLAELSRKKLFKTGIGEKF